MPVACYLAPEMKRAVVFVILTSMILHCSVRLGFVTWLYQNRQDIAYAFGFGDEPPITMCSHADDLDRAVKIEVAQDNHDKRMPVSAFQTREINLFFVSHILSNSHELALLREQPVPYVVDKDYPEPLLTVFHPPA